MTDQLFYKLWRDALAQPNLEIYIGEYGYPYWFDEISEDVNEVVSTLTAIHRVAHMTVREMIKSSGLTQAAFAVKFCIPLRTVENWAMGLRQCPDYTRLLLARQLNLY